MAACLQRTHIVPGCDFQEQLWHRKSDARGRVYRCKECEWKGEKACGLQHVAKIHADPPPFQCAACNFKTASYADLTAHSEKLRHQAKVKDFKGNPTIWHIDVKFELPLEQLSKSDSEEFWEARRCARSQSRETDCMEVSYSISTVPDPDVSNSAPPPQETSSSKPDEVVKAAPELSHRENPQKNHPKQEIG